MINYTIAEFLGIFLIGFPILLFILPIFIRGVLWIIKDVIFEDETIKNFFHHHFHYKAK